MGWLHGGVVGFPLGSSLPTGRVGRNLGGASLKARYSLAVDRRFRYTCILASPTR